MRDDLFAEIMRRLGVTRPLWDKEEIRAKVRQRYRTANVFLQLRMDTDPDASLLKDIAAEFPGLRFLIRKRELTLPEGVDEVLLDLVPRVDVNGEWWGLWSRNQLLAWLGLSNEHRVA
jgi:hypothetical protein